MSGHASLSPPRLSELGIDLLRITIYRKVLTLLLPFFWCSAYFAFSWLGYWPLAVVALICLSFVTYAPNGVSASFVESIFNNDGIKASGQYLELIFP